MPCTAHASPSKSNQRFWYLLWSGCWMCLARFVRFAFCLFTFHRKWLMMVATTTTVNRIFPTWWFHVLISFYLYERAAAALLRWFSVLNCLHSCEYTPDMKWVCAEVLSDVQFGALCVGTKCLMNRYGNEDPLQCLLVELNKVYFRVGNTVAALRFTHKQFATRNICAFIGISCKIDPINNPNQ